MKRILNRGATYRSPDGVSHTRQARDMKLGKVLHPAGTVFSTVGGRTTPGRSPEFDVSDETFAHDPSLWEPTPEETAKAREVKIAKALEWYRARGQEMPEKERKELGLAPVVKEIPGTEAEAKRGPGRPRLAVKG